MCIVSYLIFMYCQAEEGVGTITAKNIYIWGLGLFSHLLRVTVMSTKIFKGIHLFVVCSHTKTIAKTKQKELKALITRAAYGGSES